ncbi:MAG: GNAT family N-acetyltransferase [Candidatus Hydrogenedentota bacterium]|nr:MAG: GNAT family N-acetyltransferase [Candidatus Hydrogenedentota bacterium]
MTIDVELAVQSDYKWLKENDSHVDAAWVQRCIQLKEYYVACFDGKRRGFLRFGFFWGIIPYMDMIGVDEDVQRSGLGTAMFNRWENDMREKGAKILMTSSMSNEPEPQAWHRHNGFKESGQITFGSFQTTPEVFLVKELS